MFLELNAEGGVGTAGIAQLVRDWDLPSALYGTIDRMTDVNWLNLAMAALPVSVIMLFMTYGVVKSLHEDPSAVKAPDQEFAPDGTSLKADLHT